MSGMRGIGQPFPSFKLKAVVSNDPASGIIDVDSASFRGKWLIAFFYPKDFTFVCPTEIKAFGDLYSEFRDREAEVITASTDNEFVHLAWRSQKEELRNLPFPMLSDIRRDLATELGILDPNEGVAQRATYIVDPEGVIRHVSVYDLNVGRNAKEILRTLDALQTDELCPCNWQKGEKTLG